MIKRNKNYSTVNTNLNLEKAGAAAAGLNKVWTSLPGGNEEKMTQDEFNTNFKSNVSKELNGLSEIKAAKGILKI